MKKIAVVLALLLATTGSFAQVPFNSVVMDGFGWIGFPINYNKGVADLKTFKGQLYAGMGTMEGRVYRSSTGDGGSFQQVYGGPGTGKVDKFEVSNDGGGLLFAAGAPGGGLNRWVIRTSNGTNWDTLFFNSVWGGDIQAINVFKGVGAIDSVYITHYDNVGHTVIERNAINSTDPYNSSSTWQGVCNFYMEFGSGATVTASKVFNGKLYYATYDNYLYETADGRSLTSNSTFNTSMGAGSGLGNMNVRAMEVYGGELYLGTDNLNTGYEIWKTADGVNYTSLRDSLGAYEKVCRMKTAGGKLWILVSDGGIDFQVLSYDGTSFTVENTNAFGASDVNVDNFSGMEGFNNHLYVGVINYYAPPRLANPGNETFATQTSNGGQIWRACLIGAGTVPNITFSTANPRFFCAGGSATHIANAGSALSLTWQDGTTGTSLNSPDTGTIYVSGADAAGCRYSADMHVHLYPNSPAPVVTAGSNPNIVTDVAFCLGDSGTMVARDPITPFNALAIPFQNAGFVTPSTSAFYSDRDMTIEMWFKTDGYYQDAILISEGDTLASPLWSSGGNYPLIRVDNSGYVYVNVAGSSTNDFIIGQLFFNNWTTWNHVVLRYDATNSVLDGLLNGIPSSSQLAGRTRSVPQDDAGFDGYKIGFQAYVPDLALSVNNLTGQVRDVRIWNSVRTNQEITDNMYALPTGTYPTLTYYYKADDASGTVIHDATTHGYYDAPLGGATFVSPTITGFTWHPDPTLLINGSTATAFPANSHPYKVYYTDINGCTSDTNTVTAGPFYIDIYPPLAGSCGGNPASLSYNTNASMITTTWSSVTLGTVPTNSVNITPPSAEWVYVSAPLTGCVLQDSILVGVGPAFTSAVGNPMPINDCQHAELWIDGQAQGGTAPYTYIWSSTSIGHDTTYTDSLLYILPNFSDEVQLHAIDAIGCEFYQYNDFFPILSTDLHGHVSTPPPGSVNVDNGEVYVFRHQPGSAGLDTMGHASLNSNGDYLFTPLYAGDYLIKVIPDTTDFPLGVPTYYGNAFQWDSSLVYTHGCAQTDTADIQLVVMDGTTGTASISGYIIEGDSFGAARFGSGTHPLLPCVPGGPLKGIDVKLGKNPGGGIQARVSSDSTGFYEFTNVPDGGYNIYVDIPNLPMDSTRHITITAGDSSVQNNYFADSASIYINPDTIVPVGIYASAKKYENNFEIYPNPAHGALYVNYTLKQSDYVSFEIRNAMGQLIRTEPSRKHPEGKNIFVFNTDQLNLQSGVYFISILTDNKKYTQRLVVID